LSDVLTVGSLESSSRELIIPTDREIARPPYLIFLKMIKKQILLMESHPQSSY
jgi:hypothetical protein